MKRYILFAYDDYYPQGGFEDMHSDYDTLAEAVAFVNKRGTGPGRPYLNVRGNDAVYVADRDTGMCIWQRGDPEPEPPA